MSYIEIDSYDTYLVKNLEPVVTENYLLALCECEQKNEILLMLEIIDITKLSSTVLAVNIFKCLARLSLHSFAEKLLVAFKTSGMLMITINFYCPRNFMQSYLCKERIWMKSDILKLATE